MDDGSKLASAGDDIRLWDVASSSTPSHQFTPHAGGVSSISWSHNNQILASAGSSGDKLVLTFVKNAASNIIEIAQEEKQTYVAFNSTSRYLLSGGKSGIVNIWDLKSRRLKKTYTGHQDAVTCLAFNWNDTHIASGSASGDILLHNVVSGQTSHPLTTPKVQSIRGLEYSHFKKSLLAAVSDNGGLTMWDTNLLKPIAVIKDAHRAPATALAFSPVNEMLLLSCGLDKRVLCYDVHGKGVVKSMTVESPLTSISCMYDGATLAIGSTRGKIYIFDLRAGSNPLKVIHGHKSSVQSVRFQHAPITKSNGVSSKSTKPAQPLGSGRKLPQAGPEVAHVTPIIQRARKPVTDTTDSTLNLSIVREDIGNQDIISPIREGSLAAVRHPDGVNHISRPDVVTKIEGTPSQSKDSLPDFFSPLSENTTINTVRRNPIGLLELEPQPPINFIQPITTSVPNDMQLYGADEVVSSNAGVTSRTNSTSSEPTGFKPDWNGVAQTKASTTPIYDPDKSLTSPPRIAPSFGVAGLSPETEPVRLRSATYPTSATSMDRGATKAAVTTLPNNVDQDAKPFSSPSRRTGSPARGLLGGSSDAVHRALDGQPRTHLDDRGDAQRLAGGGALQPFHVQFIKNMIDDSLEEFKESFHREILHLQREMVRQFQIQQNQMHDMLEKYSINEGLLTELERLREENKKLKAKY